MDKNVIKKLAKGLNEIGCTWAIGSSVVLNYYGLVEKPNDIDVLIDAKDAQKVINYMDTIGTYVKLGSKDPFRTEEFFAYMVDDVMVEFMGDFKIQLDDGSIYKFILDKDAIKDNMIIDDVKVNITTLEDWIVAYSVMKDPKKRVPLLNEYFKKHGIKNRSLLERNLNNNLPDSVRANIESMLLNSNK